jgi:hypothetical protein
MGRNRESHKTSQAKLGAPVCWSCQLDCRCPGEPWWWRDRRGQDRCRQPCRSRTWARSLPTLTASTQPRMSKTRARHSPGRCRPCPLAQLCASRQGEVRWVGDRPNTVLASSAWTTAYREYPKLSYDPIPQWLRLPGRCHHCGGGLEPRDYRGNQTKIRSGPERFEL